MTYQPPITHQLLFRRKQRLPRDGSPRRAANRYGNHWIADLTGSEEQVRRWIDGERAVPEDSQPFEFRMAPFIPIKVCE